VHCVQAQSRTPTIGAAYLIRRFGQFAEEALAEVENALRTRPWNQRFVEALGRLKRRRSAESPNPG
jgi:hypothetical protein